MKQTHHTVFLQALGSRLRDLRRLRGLSQEELAWKADVELSQISRIERGVINTSIGQLLNIVDALDISLTEFFAFDQSVAGKP
ncbi:MAG: helix-turn-helix transcriptional regulator [Saprospiraceae bacterium]